MNPFVVLNLSLECTDQEVRAAYRQGLRQYSPETHPHQFQAIQAAYELLRTERDRWRWHLLHDDTHGTGIIETLKAFARLPGRAQPPGRKAFRDLLAAAAAAAARDATGPDAPSSSPSSHSRTAY